MKTLFNNNATRNFNFSFDVLTSVELSLVKGGRDIDIIIPPVVDPIATAMSISTTTNTTVKPGKKTLF